jgi:hypothetical protein
MDSLDLFQQRFARRPQQAVNPPTDAEDESVCGDLVFHGDFRLVPRWPRALDFLMATNPLHRPIRPDEMTFARDIAPAQDELDEFAHLDGKDWFYGHSHGLTRNSRPDRIRQSEQMIGGKVNLGTVHPADYNL